MSVTSVTSVVLLEDGTITKEYVGHASDESHCQRQTILYQKDMLPLPSFKRSQDDLLSKYKIVYKQIVCNVPWASFSWINGPIHAISKCKSCKRSDCMHAFEHIRPENVAVVWMNGPNGEKIYRWYVTFKNNQNILTRIPMQLYNKIACTGNIVDYCRCGNCKHPLFSMIDTFVEMSPYDFEERCVTYFNETRKLITKQKHKLNESSQYLVYFNNTQQMSTNDETCAICLEEKSIVKNSCLRNLCTLSVCKTCYVKTRGMCPLCDRYKLGKATKFMCHTCSSCSQLNEFGYECLQCKGSKLCLKCFKSFSVCANCEEDIIDKHNKKKKLY
jgi:hypothetical protein